MANLPSDYDTTPSNNTTITGIDAAEGMAAANTNNLIRDLAATIAKGWGGMYEGTSRPAAVQTGHFWRDITASTVPIIKLYDGTDDITVMTFDYSANTVTFSGSTSAASITVADSGAFFADSDVEAVLADIGGNYAKLAAPAFTGTVTMAGKLETNGELQIDAVVQTPAEVFASSGTIALTMTGANKKTIALATNTTITVSAEVADQVVEVWITQTGGGGTAAWSGVNKWVGGSAPTLSTTTGQIDIIILASASDGTTIVAQHIGVAS